MVRAAWLAAGALSLFVAVSSRPPAAAAEDPKPAANESPAAKMKREWAAADDAARKALLADVVGLADSAGFHVIAGAASAACDEVEEADALAKKMAAAASSGDALAVPNATDQERLEREGREATRARHALADLGAAAGSVLDALPDAEFTKAVTPFLSGVPRSERASWTQFAIDTLGATHQERTMTLLLAEHADALKDAKKALAARAVPAGKLDEVLQKIADIVNPILKKQQEAGDFSAKVPESVLGVLPAKKAELEREIQKFQQPIDYAETRRRVCRDALGISIGGQPAPAMSKSLDVVEKQLLASADVAVRAFGVGVLGPVPGDRAFARLSSAAADPDPAIVVAALDALGKRAEKEVVPVLARSLVDTRWQVRAAAASGLASAGRAEGVPALVLALRTATGRTLDDVRDALVRLTGRHFAASELPWKAWWDKEGATFHGARDERPAGSAAASGDPGAQPPAAAAPEGDEGGVTFYGITTHSTRMLFVLDVSGSMNFPATEGTGAKKKIETLRAEVKRTITGLADGSTFGMIAFASDVRVWKKEPVVRSSKTAADAITWVEKADAIGGTNIHDALETAFKLAKPASGGQEPVYDTIFFMTDGTPSVGKITDPDAILREVRRWNESKKIRIHVIGMGGHTKNPGGAGGAGGGGKKLPEFDLDEAFLKALAAMNGGQCVIR